MLLRKSLEFTAELPPQARRHRRFEELFILAGRPDRAQKLHEEFVALLPEATRENAFWRHALRRDQAAIMAAEGRGHEAVEIFKAVRRDNPQCAMCDLANIGHAYDVAGEADSVLAYFTQYLETQGNRFNDDQEWLAAILRRSGELHEARGENAKAIEYYDRFVDLWDDADPDLQTQVSDARARIARLVGENR